MTDLTTGAYKIAQVERITGVGVHTLRAWERRYGVPEPDRSGGRQRLYSTRDIELVTRMRRLSEQGVPLGKAADMARLEMRERGGHSFSEAVAGKLFRSLLNWDEARAADSWMEMLDSFDIQTAFQRVVIPVLKDVGDGWHAGTVSVGQEHFATNFIRSRLDVLGRQATPREDAPSVLFACLQGEQHEMGILMLAVMARLAGLRTIYLGRDVPDEALVRTVEDSQPNVIAVNAGSAEAARRFAKLAPLLEGAAPLAAVVVGGRGFDSDAEARAIPGAHYAGPTLDDAVITINHLGRKVRAGGPR